jgi:outer membrane protein assembly factor BamA
MIILKKTYLLILILGSSISAQTIDSLTQTGRNFFRVDSIEIVGNKETEDFVMLRELTFSVGDTVDEDILHFNRERIFSLGIFTRVELVHRVENKKNIVQIRIEESWNIIPVPFIIIRERKFSRTSFGVSLKYKNFRGRNETIRATVVVGYDPFFSLEYENPNLIYSKEIAFYLAGIYGSPINKSPTLEKANGGSFDFKTFGISTTLGKRLTRVSNLYFSLSYSKLQAPSNKINNYMASGTSTDENFGLGFSFLFDSRNLKQYASKGNYLFLNYIYNGLFNNQIDYGAVNIDLRDYRKVYAPLMIKTQISARLTFGGYVPHYAYSMLGYDYYTRGNRYLTREGNHRVLGTIEIGYPILPEWNFGIKVPVLPNSLTRARIAIIASVFADAGTIFNKTSSLCLNEFNFGYGGGISLLILPYNAFRIQYAFNEFGKGELILDTQISF